MSSFGSVMQALISQKNNRSALRSKRADFQENMDTTYESGKKLQFKQVSAEKLEQIKLKIRQKALLDRARNKKIFRRTILVLSLIIAMIIWL